MNLLVLDATTKSIKAVLSGAVATTQPTYTVHYADATTTAITEGESDGAFNSTTAITILAAPAASTQRIIRELTVYNNDTASITFSLNIDTSGTGRIFKKVTLATGESWAMGDATGGSGGSSFTAATQAEQEAGTSTTVGVTPGRQQYHPSAVKVACSFNGTGTPAILASYNVTSLTDGGTGVWTVNFTNSFSSATFIAVGMDIYSSNSSYGNKITHSTKATGSVLLFCTTIVNAGLDVADVNVICVGDQ